MLEPLQRFPVFPVALGFEPNAANTGQALKPPGYRKDKRTEGAKKTTRAAVLILAWLFCAVNFMPIYAQTAQQPQLTLSHNSEVKGATWSPDGSRIVAWTDGDAYIWDAQTGDQLFTIKHGGGLSRPFYGPIWSSDQQKILSWQEKKVWIWDVKNGIQLQTFEHEKEVDGVIWSPNGDHIVSWNSFSQTNSTPKYEILLFIWDSASGQQATAIHVPGAFLQGVKWSPDETWLMTLTTGEGGGIKAWSATDGTEMRAFNQPGTLSLSLGDVVWSKDHNRILVSGINGEAYVADAKTGARILSIQNDSWIWGAYWNVDESKIMGLLPNNRVIYIWDANTGVPILTLRHEDFVTNANWSADGNRILTSSSNGFDQSAINIWDAVAGYNLFKVNEATRSASAAWDVSEKFVLGWFTDPFEVDKKGTWKVWEWNVNRETELHSGSQSGGVLGVLSPLWSPTESRLLTWNGSDIQVWKF